MDLGAVPRGIERRANLLRERSGALDHVMAMLGHYGRVDGVGQAGAVTYFAFLAFFPLLALTFFLIGQAASVYPDARHELVRGINYLLQGLVGEGPNQVSLDTFQNNAGKAGLLGLLGFLYAGLGWMSAMRNALQTLFAKPVKERPNIFVGKARDLMTLGVVGVMMLLSIALSSAVGAFSPRIIESVGLDPDATGPNVGLRVVGVVLALGLSTALLLVIYRLLVRPRVSRRALFEGALFAAVGFELLKLAAGRLIELTHGQPAFTIFGVALVVLVLINYFSRAVMYGAAWAYTSHREPDLNMEGGIDSPHWRPDAPSPADS